MCVLAPHNSTCSGEYRCLREAILRLKHALVNSRQFKPEQSYVCNAITESVESE